MPDGHGRGDFARHNRACTDAALPLFNACIDASEILDTDGNFRNELIAKRATALRPRWLIGSDGRVMEWPEEYKEADIHHRHISHLWGLYPGDEITPEGTPALAESFAQKTLIARGDDSVGWGYAYKAALWATKAGRRQPRLVTGAAVSVTGHGNGYSPLRCRWRGLSKSV